MGEGGELGILWKGDLELELGEGDLNDDERLGVLGREVDLLLPNRAIRVSSSAVDDFSAFVGLEVSVFPAALRRRAARSRLVSLEMMMGPSMLRVKPRSS